MWSALPEDREGENVQEVDVSAGEALQIATAIAHPAKVQMCGAA